MRLRDLAIPISILLGFMMLSTAVLVQDTDFESCMSSLRASRESRANGTSTERSAASRDFALGRLCAGSPIRN